jgi:hypothetical protein
MPYGPVDGGLDQHAVLMLDAGPQAFLDQRHQDRVTRRSGGQRFDLGEQRGR